MKILHVISNSGMGGAERAVSILASEQTHSGHEVSIITPAESASRDSQGLRGWPLPGTSGTASRRLRQFRDLTSPFGSLGDWTDADIVHGHLTWGSLALARLRSSSVFARRRTKLVFTDHSAGMKISTPSKVAGWVGSHVANGQISVMPRHQPGDQSPTHFLAVIPNAVDWKLIRQAESVAQDAAWGTDSGLVIGSLGHLRRDRQPDVYIDLLEALHHRIGTPDLVLDLGGDGSERSALQKRAFARGLGQKVRFRGFVQDRRAFFSSITVHVSLGLRGGVGLSSMEAACFGVPTVALQLDRRYDGRRDAFPSHSDIGVIAEWTSELLLCDDARATLARVQAEHVRANHNPAFVSEAHLAFYDSLRTT